MQWSQELISSQQNERGLAEPKSTLDPLNPVQPLERLKLLNARTARIGPLRRAPNI